MLVRHRLTPNPMTVTPMDQSLSLPQHQKGLLAGVKRFVPEGPVRQQAEAWATQHLARRP